MLRYWLYLFSIICALTSCKESKLEYNAINATFYLEERDNEILAYLEGQAKPIVVQNVKTDMRPFLHPILAPDSDISLTQYSPDHHKHQTGLYWGFTRVNGSGIDDTNLNKWFYNKNKPSNIQSQIGRDYFHNNGEDYWKKVSSTAIIDEGEEVKWQTVYNMLDEDGIPIMEETQTWTLTRKDNNHLLSLEWSGKALIDITINRFDYGGLFLRMPWHKGIEGEAINAARQINDKAEGQRAMWVDVGMEIDGLEDWGHMAIFDHPNNDGYPNAWRVDGQLGIGPIRAKATDWSIPKGEVVTFKHQIVAYIGNHSDVELNELWAQFVGDDGMYNTASLWSIAQEEGRNAKFLNPQEAVDKMTIKEGYKVNAFASEPMITQPMAFCWDDKGRLWIAENRDYESRGYGFSKYGDSRILILEDTDHDGVADSQKVFLEGVPFPSAIAVGFDGLFLGAPPNLLFVPDKDHDDKADVEDIEVRLTGWGIRDRHETINSFHWGPDGWLYGLEGFATPSVIRKPVGKGRVYKAGEAFPEDLLDADGVDMNGGVFRYHPTKDKFEVVSHGFSNPWGIDYDAKGQLFISACVIPHLFHIIPGGIYQRQGGRHFNPYVYEDIQTIVDHRHRSAHGGARIYQSDAFDEEHQGRIFMANIHEHAVLSDVLKPNGSGFTASHGEDFMLANNAQWIGFSMEVGPDGGLYVLDWHDADICGKEVLNKETGRVFRIMPEATKAEPWKGRYENLNNLSDLELADLQWSKSNWHERRARLILQNRATKGPIDNNAIAKLKQLLKDGKTEDHRLKGLWTLHAISALSREDYLSLLKDKDLYVQAWAIQFLTEEDIIDENVITAFNRISKSTSADVVKLYLSAALQKLNSADRWTIAENILKGKLDEEDPNIPFMLWFGIEPIITSDIQRSLALAEHSSLTSISSKIIRRLLDDDQIESVATAISPDSKSLKPILEGMLAGIQGRNDLAEPKQWSAIYSKLSEHKEVGPIVKAIGQQFGNLESASRMMAILEDQESTIEEKKEAVKGLAANQREELAIMIPSLITDDGIRKEVIRAIASFDKKELGQLLLDSYDGFSEEEQQEAIQTFASRSVYGQQLAYALKDERISKRDVPAYVALQLRRVVGNGFVEIWGPIDEISGDKKAEIDTYQRLLSDEVIAKANLQQGQDVFRRTCYVCHKMYGEGGLLGPELTGSNRGNSAYLLSNMIDPSGELQDDYKLVVITSRDGRTFTGNIVAESERQITLRTVNQGDININKSVIQNREISPKSMMPEGLLRNLTNQEVIDLVAYLKKSEGAIL